VNDQFAVGATMFTVALVAGTGLARWAAIPARERLTEDDLLGPPSAYTTQFEHAPAAFRRAFGDCPNCGPGRPGSSNKDGWLCGECLQPITTGGTR